MLIEPFKKDNFLRTNRKLMKIDDESLKKSKARQNWAFGNISMWEINNLQCAKERVYVSLETQKLLQNIRFYDASSWELINESNWYISKHLTY